MNRRWFVSLSLVALGWMVGCGGGSSSSGGSTPQTNAFNGQYAFVLSGFDANGNSLGIAGSMKADGLGHISAGEVDVNDNGTRQRKEWVESDLGAGPIHVGFERRNEQRGI